MNSQGISNTEVSILIPVFNPDPVHLRLAVESAARQTYPLTEVILIDDCSTIKDTHTVLSELLEQYANLKLIKLDSNLGISGATQAGLENANGEWIGLLDQDDLLELNAVEHMMLAIENANNVVLAYSDSDKIGLDGKFRDPFIKPDWSPERLRGNMYLAHFTFFKRSAAIEVGGFRSEYDGAQDHDLALRLSEISSAVVHIPEILYHWRMTQNSTALNPDSKKYAVQAGQRAIGDQLRRLGIQGTTAPIENYPGFYTTNRVASDSSKFSVVIPTRGGSGLVLGEDKPFIVRCIESIAQRPSSHLGEVILVADVTDDVAYLDVVQALLPGKVKVINYEKAFNFSEKVNMGIEASQNEFIFLLNDDISIISDEWAEPILSLLEQQDVGAVGPLLFFEDETIQHAGHFYAYLGATHRYLGEKISPGYFGDLILEHEVSGLTAAFICFRKDVWRQVAGFSLDFPNNFNDVDFCLKVLEHGYRNIFTPQVTAYHFESKTRDTTVAPGEVLRIQQNWGHRLGTLREPYGPGGKPKDFGETNLKFREYNYHHPSEYKNTYKFRFVCNPEIDPIECQVMSTQFELINSEFETYNQGKENVTVVDIRVEQQVIFGWNILHELALAFDSGLQVVYSDYVNSNSLSQNLMKLPAWSPERFLGIDYLGPCVAFAVEAAEQVLLDSSESRNYVNNRNNFLMSASPAAVGRVPEILYRTVGAESESQVTLHNEWALHYLETHRVGAHAHTSTANSGLVQISYSGLARGSVSIVIPTRFSVEENGSRPALFACLDSIINQDLGALKVEIQVVFDTDSQDSWLEEAQQKYTSQLDISFIEFSESFNFARKCNLGAYSTKSDAILFLNDDTELLTSTTLSELIGNLYVSEKVGAVGALLWYPNQLVQHAGIIMATPGPGHAYFRQEAVSSALGDAFVSHEVSGVTGACIAIKRDLFDEINGWNEEFPSSFNDVEFCIKVRRLGKSIILNSRAQLTHHESLSRNPYATNRDLLLLEKFCGEELQWEPYLRMNAVHGFDDDGNKLSKEMKPDLSGKYFQYAIYLIRSFGFKSLVQTGYRKIIPKYRSLNKLKIKKSYF